MKPQEAEAIALAGTPVMYKGIKYKCINAVIHRVRREFRQPARIKCSVELQSIGANSVTVVPVDEVEKVEQMPRRHPYSN